MITRAKAPLRLGLAGGGTDVSPFCDIHGGCVLNATINLYATCILEDLTNTDTIFEATDFQKTDTISTLEECSDEGLRLHRGVYRRIVNQFLNGIAPALRVTTYCDAPPGSGLGSSSTMVVSMIQALSLIHISEPTRPY